MSTGANQWTWADERQYLVEVCRDIPVYQELVHRLRRVDFVGHPISGKWLRKFDSTCVLAMNQRQRIRARGAGRLRQR